jgi:hypothetical protein
MVRDSENNPLLSVTIDELVSNRFLDLNAYPNYDNIYIEFKRGTPNVEMSGTAYFQIEEGTNATAYEPHAKATMYTPNSDGTVDGVTSIYPTTILTTDTEGVTIDVEYNRDANKVVAELLDIIINGKSFVTDVKIFASKWVGTASPYSQVVTVEGATSRSQVDLTPSAEQLSIFHNKDLAFVTENNNGVITVYAIGQKPMNDYTIQATVTEVKA